MGDARLAAARPVRMDVRVDVAVRRAPLVWGKSPNRPPKSPPRCPRSDRLVCPPQLLWDLALPPSRQQPPAPAQCRAAEAEDDDSDEEQMQGCAENPRSEEGP